MANTIKILRSTGTTAPSQLSAGELAFTGGAGTQANLGQRIFIGDPANSNAVTVIGGNYFTNLMDHAHGTVTASSVVIVDSTKKVNEWLVDNLKLDTSTLSSTNTNGDIILNPHGTGKLDIDTPTIELTSQATSVTIVDNNAASLVFKEGSNAYLSFITTDGSEKIQLSKELDINAVSDFGSNAMTNVNIDSGTIDGTTIGGATPAVGTFTTLTANTSLVGTLGTAAQPTITSLGTIASLVATTADIDEGTIDNTIIGASTPVVGTFTTLTANTSLVGTLGTVSQPNITSVGTLGALTVDNIVIDGTTIGHLSDTDLITLASGALTVAGTLTSTGDISGTLATVAQPNITSLGIIASLVATTANIDNGTVEAVIGATTPKAGTFTTLTANTSISGTLATTAQPNVISLGTLTALTVDDLTINDAQISTSESNNNIALSPHGTGTVTVPSGYKDRSGFGATSLTSKEYVDALKTGLDVKDSVRVATAGSAQLGSDFDNGDSIDGVTLATGDRILIKDQSTGSQNGIYTINASGAPTRAIDFDDNAEVTGGAFTFVEEGTVNADSGWVVTNNGAITVGTTALTFAQFSGAGQITAGTALTKSGNTLNVAVDDKTLEISSDALRFKGVSQTATGDLVVGSGGANGGYARLAISGTSGALLQSNGSTTVWSNIVDGGTF